MTRRNQMLKYVPFSMTFIFYYSKSALHRVEE